MPQSFSLTPSRCAVISDPTLREEIQRYTESSDATARILSCLGRFGGDPSILRFEMSPAPHVRATRLAGAAAWTVRAVRLQPEAQPTA